MQPSELWLILFALAALSARLGICLYLSGMCRARNAAAACLRSIADACIAVIAFWAVGFAILSPASHAWFGLHGSFTAAAFFNASMVLIATGAALGGTLGRTRMLAPLTVSALLAGIVVPLAGRWVWSGWLHDLGFIDIAGDGPLHLCGALAALTGAAIARPRGGKYNRDGSTNLIPGHSVPYAAVGAMALAFGFIAQITGCAILRDSSPGAAAANALLASAAGGCGALLLARQRYRIADIHLFLAGFLAGLVTTAAGAGNLSSPLAAAVGLLAGILTPTALVWLDLRLRIDDPSSAVATHFVGGTLGLLAAAFSAGVTSPVKQLGIQLLGILAISALALIASGAVFMLMRSANQLRLSEADELDGDDLVEHDLNAYPDFQQTMIKSYHLRET